MKPSDTLRPFLSRSRIILGWFLFASPTMTGYVPTARSQSVSTYHYDNLRTGWSSNETTLTPQDVASTNFHLLTTVPLDEQVDAQPLLVTGLSIAGGTHDVLYVATENNSLYALDAATGSILLTRDKATLGSPAPQSVLPGQCNKQLRRHRHQFEPMIDLAGKTMYVMVYSYEGSSPAPIYRLHAIDVTTLNDKVAPAVVSASASLSSGGVYKFNPSVTR